MAVVRIDAGVVVQTWRDVETVEQAVEKYGIDPVDLVEGDHAPGTLYDGSVFSPPPQPPQPTLTESPERQAIRQLAIELGEMAEVKIEAILGARP